MLRHKPAFKYSGLTIILSQPSRFDFNKLLDGVSGHWFEKECLAPELNRHICDIRLADEPEPLLDDTKVILTLGAKAFSKYSGQPLLTLDEGRGSPYIRLGIPTIATFSPQDAMDLKDFESKYNEHLAVSEDEIESDELKAGEAFAAKGRGRTSRSNYRFWIKQDVKKAIRILKNNGVIPSLYEREPTYWIIPDLSRTIDVLSTCKNVSLFFDIETDFSSVDMRCFAFSTSSDPYNIYAVPWLDVNYKPYYGLKQYLLWKALTKAVRDCELIAHNGSQFDFPVLAWKYKIPVNKVYDTLIAQHRIYPTVEKSLGHCVSLATYEPYHKNEGAHGFHSEAQVRQLLQYCAKDVFTMWLVKKWQDEMASKDEGLKASIQLANEAIVPYMTTSLMGFHYDEEARQKWIKEKDRLMNWYMRIMEKLCGDKVDPLISNQKCVKYFHEMMGYPIVSRTKGGNASLAKDALLKLSLKVKNPVLNLLAKYRGAQKEIGTLNFNPWIKE